MGVAPLQFMNDESWESLGLDGSETIDVEGLATLKPRDTVKVTITFADGTKKAIDVLARVDTQDELDYYTHGGILRYVLRNLAA